MESGPKLGLQLLVPSEAKDTWELTDRARYVSGPQLRPKKNLGAAKTDPETGSVMCLVNARTWRLGSSTDLAEYGEPRLSSLGLEADVFQRTSRSEDVENEVIFESEHIQATFSRH